MYIKQYRQETLDERKRHNQAIERRNIERDIKRDNERREQERQYRNRRIFSNVLSAPQSSSNIIRSVLAYCLIIMLVVNFVRVTSGFDALTVTSFFEVMSNCPDVDFTSAMVNIPNYDDNVFLFGLNGLLKVVWNPLVALTETIVDIYVFVTYLVNYLMGWVV